MEARVFVFPTSALKINDKKINYFEYISKEENEECRNALYRIYPKIDLKEINKVIDETLMREYGKCSLNKIAQKLGCYRSSLRYRAQILGLL